jgi:hypothetical protein
MKWKTGYYELRNSASCSVLSVRIIKPKKVLCVKYADCKGNKNYSGDLDWTTSCNSAI